MSLLVFDWSLSITYCSTCAVIKLLYTKHLSAEYDNMTKTLGVTNSACCFPPPDETEQITFPAWDARDDVTGPFTMVISLLNGWQSQDQSNKNHYLP